MGLGSFASGIGDKFVSSSPIGKMTGASSLQDLLMGRQVGPDPEAATLKAYKMRGLKLIRQQMEAERKAPSGEALARLTNAQQLKGIKTAREDASRRLNDIIAQRGLRGTSAGLTQQVGLSRKFAENAGNIRASLPAMIAQRQAEKRQRVAGLAGALTQQTGQIPLRFGTERQGGLAPLIGAGIGGIMGGPGGAQIGGGIGSGLLGMGR